jgi:uncharacterized iron-regulated membrane protein
MPANTGAPSPRTRARGPSPELRAFLARLHFYAGLFAGPFILIAALTGTLYVLTPQIEDHLYADALRAQTTGGPQPLSEQIEAARASLGGDPAVVAIRPAPAPGSTTRVMFRDPTLGEAETRAIFVDPVSLKIQGSLAVYGTSGTLPFRTALDYLHRDLMLGDLGRNYSELAASWLFVTAFGGILMWAWRPRAAAPLNARAQTRRLHGQFGIWMSVGLIFLSLTGLTWSRWAGGNIDVARAQLGWITPSVSSDLKPAGMAMPMGEHAEHQAMAMGEHAEHHDMAAMGAHAGHQVTPERPAPTTPAVPQTTSALADSVLAAARSAGIDSPYVELKAAGKPGKAWLVREYDRSWPTQVDAVAIDPATLQVTSRADFATFPLAAKLIRWGVDTHMGILFGVANQIVMALIGVALMVMTVLGYRIWWLRRPAPGAPVRPLVAAWTALSPLGRGVAAVLALVVGWALPLLGISLLVFLAVDIVHWLMSRQRAEPIAPPLAG